jgi:hypothetical protein
MKFVDKAGELRDVRDVRDCVTFLSLACRVDLSSCLIWLT